jgi:hypothetical protein
LPENAKRRISVGRQWILVTALAKANCSVTSRRHTPGVAFASAEAVTQPARRDPAYDSAFRRTRGWTGADGAYSLKLSTGRVLWLFSDTLVGRVTRAGKRILDSRVPINALDVRALHSTAALQDSADPGTVHFIIPGGEAHPRTLFQPPDGRGWIWVNGAEADARGGATVLLNQFLRSSDPRFPFGKQEALWAADLEVKDNDVRVRGYHRLDLFGGPGLDETVMGAGVLQDGRWTYVYGARGYGEKHLLIARVPRGHLADAQAYLYFDGQGFVKDAAKVAELPLSVANELSVHREGRTYVLTSSTFAGPVELRTAATPWGPWSKPTAVWVPPEVGGKVFTYNAKAHPELSSPSEGLLVSYNVNSLDEDESLHQADVYRPRFLRVSRPGPTSA